MIDGQLRAGENPDLPGPNIRCRNEKLCILAGPHALEVDQLVEGVSQGIDVKRIQIVGARHPRPGIEPERGRRPADAPEAQQLIEERALNGRQDAVETDALPELSHLLTRTVAPTFEPALEEDNGIHGARTGARDCLDGEASILEEVIQDAPGKGTVGTPA